MKKKILAAVCCASMIGCLAATPVLADETVKADGDVAKVAVEGEFSLTVKGANGSYTVSDLKVGSVEGNGAYAATVAVAEDGTVTATITGAAGACTVTVQNGNVTLDIAKAVQEKYGFVISK